MLFPLLGSGTSHPRGQDQVTQNDSRTQSFIKRLEDSWTFLLWGLSMGGAGLSWLSLLCAPTWSLRTLSLAWGTISFNIPSFVYLLCNLTCITSITNPDGAFPSPYPRPPLSNNFPGWAGTGSMEQVPHLSTVSLGGIQGDVCPHPGALGGLTDEWPLGCSSSCCVDLQGQMAKW